MRCSGSRQRGGWPPACGRPSWTLRLWPSAVSNQGWGDCTVHAHTFSPVTHKENGVLMFFPPLARCLFCLNINVYKNGKEHFARGLEKYIYKICSLLTNLLVVVGMCSSFLWKIKQKWLWIKNKTHETFFYMMYIAQFRLFPLNTLL